MLNRIRISTTLFLILILCGVLQVGSNGLSFWAFRDGYQNLQEVEASNQQRSALAQTRAVLLQASTALNKAGTLTALSYPPDDIKALMATARNSLKQADAQFKTFTAQEDVSEKGKALKAAMKKNFEQWHSDLDHQATWLENNQLSDFMSAPVQASQAAFDDSFNAWQQDINQFVQRAGESSRMSYHMSGVIFTVVVILAALLTGAALLWSRKMIVQPLAIISSHFDSIAKGDLARPVAVYGKNEISAIFASLKAMQGSLRETVSDVRQGSYAMHTGISEIAAGNNDLFPHRATGGLAGANGGQHGTADCDGKPERRQRAPGVRPVKTGGDDGEEGGRPGVSCGQHHAGYCRQFAENWRHHQRD